jgi:tetratricopeptide (TPR) repeat protein
MRQRGRALRELGSLAEEQKQLVEALSYYRRAVDHYQYFRREAVKLNDTAGINDVGDEIEEISNSIRSVETAIEQQQRATPSPTP